MRNTVRLRIKRRIYSLFIFLLIIIALFYIKLPYYVTYPGEAEPLDEMVTVEGGYKEDGDFMLTTIRLGKATVIQYIIAHFNKYHMLYTENQIKRDWESDRDYDHRQLKIMENSQQMSTLVAFQLANEPIEVRNEGVIVSGTIKNMPAEKKLQVGDVIVAVDDQKIDHVNQLLDYLKNKKQGDVVQLTIERDNKEQKVRLSIAKFPEKYAANKDEIRYGIGIVGPVTKTVIETEKKVTFDTDNIGGPSAGLMFTLEIYSQLTDKDITKGYKIAGTGEIYEDGKIGAIGGVAQKVVAAHKAGADIFFAPVAGNNYEDAKKAAKDIRTKMKIVPLSSVYEALDYLEKLEPKN